MIRRLGGVRRAATAAAAASAEALGTYPGRMVAWRTHAYGGIEELRMEEARVPPLRAPDDLLVRVATASINPIDVAMLGGYGARLLNVLRSLEDTAGVEFPLVPGRDFVGVVERAGATAQLRPGTRVWGVVPPHRPGSHAQYVVIKDRWAGPAPLAFDDKAAGSTLYAALSACAALRVAGLANGWRKDGASGRRVLLLGLGGVGQAALQILVHIGAQVTVGCSSDLTELAVSLGAVDVLDRHAQDYDQLLEKNGPYEVILDCAGLGGDAASSRRWRFARYVTLTTPLLRETDVRGTVLGAAAAAAALTRQCAAAARLPGYNGTSSPTLPPHVRWAYFMPCSTDITMLQRLADAQKFKVVVERVYPWTAAPDAYAHAARGHARGKLLIDFTTPATPSDTTSESSPSH